MKNSCNWEVGGVYLLSCGLKARIIDIRPRAVPKDLTSEERKRLYDKPHYGIEGYVYPTKEEDGRYLGSWTMEGVHSVETMDTFADLTTKRIGTRGEK